MLWSSSSDDNFYGGIFVGFFLGVITFFRGFRAYRRYRLIADVPQIPIRSVPMGLVKVRGKAGGEQVINSPVSHISCLFYKVDIQKWSSDSHGGNWSHYATDADGANFYLEDATGKVLVDAHGCDYDLQETSKRELSSSANAETDVELRRYIFSAGSRRFTRFAERMISRAPAGLDREKSAKLQLLAQSLHAFNQGTATNPGHMPNLLQPMLAIASQQLNDPQHEQERQAALQHLTELQSSGQLLGDFEPVEGRFRLNEYCILPGYEYELTGTCIENPACTGLHDRNLITKGTNDPTFLISWRSEKGLESSLRNKAALMIFGGGAAAVVCLAILLAKFKLF